MLHFVISFSFPLPPPHFLKGWRLIAVSGLDWFLPCGREFCLYLRWSSSGSFLGWDFRWAELSVAVCQVIYADVPSSIHTARVDVTIETSHLGGLRKYGIKELNLVQSSTRRYLLCRCSARSLDTGQRRIIIVFLIRAYWMWEELLANYWTVNKICQ